MNKVFIKKKKKKLKNHPMTKFGQTDSISFNLLINTPFINHNHHYKFFFLGGFRI